MINQPRLIDSYTSHDTFLTEKLMTDEKEVKKATGWLIEHPEFVKENIDFAQDVYQYYHLFKRGYSIKENKANLGSKLQELLSKFLSGKSNQWEIEVKSYLGLLASLNNKVYQEVNQNIEMNGGLIAILKDERLKTLNSLHNLCSELLESLSDHPLKRDKQANYTKQFNDSVQEAANLINQKKSFKTIINYLANQRQIIAKDNLHYPLESFGKERTTSRVIDRTPMRGQYSVYKDKVASFIPVDSQNYSFHYTFLPDTTGIFGTTVKEVLGAKGEISLTQFVLATQYIEKSENEFIFGKEENDYPSLVLIHTRPFQVPAILDHVSGLVDEFIQSKEPVENQLPKLAEISWWMSHAMPWQRGSASIMEMLLKSLVQSKGYDISWDSLKQEQKAVDLEALSTPHLQDFVKAFPNLITLTKLNEN